MKKAVTLLLGNDPQAIQSHLSIHLEEIQEIANTVCINKFFSSNRLILLILIVHRNGGNSQRQV